jgi:hypothetical protein
MIDRNSGDDYTLHNDDYTLHNKRSDLFWLQTDDRPLVWKVRTPLYPGPSSKTFGK